MTERYAVPVPLRHPDQSPDELRCLNQKAWNRYLQLSGLGQREKTRFDLDAANDALDDIRLPRHGAGG